MAVLTAATKAQLGRPLDDLRLRQRKCLVQREYYMKRANERADYQVLGAFCCPLPAFSVSDLQCAASAGLALWKRHEKACTCWIGFGPYRAAMPVGDALDNRKSQTVARKIG